MLLTTIVGMALVIGLLWREVGPLRREVRIMRSRLGELSVDDATRACGIEVHQSDPSRWRWRIYLPPGGNYKLLEFGGTLPPRGTRNNRQWLNAMKSAQYGIGRSAYHGADLEAEFTIDATLASHDGMWRFETYPGGGESDYVFTDNWPAATSRFHFSDLNERSQRNFKPGEPILLLYLTKPTRTPALGGGQHLQLPSEPEEGIALWLE